MPNTTLVSGGHDTGKGVYKEQHDLILCPVDQRDALQRPESNIFILFFS
jgi:hypothetical protein